MNKIVREHYPVEKLPEDLRRQLGDAKAVRLTLEPERPSSGLTDILRRARQLRSEGAIKPLTTDEAVARVRALRDEWDA